MILIAVGAGELLLGGVLLYQLFSPSFIKQAKLVAKENKILLSLTSTPTPSYGFKSTISPAVSNTPYISASYPSQIVDLSNWKLTLPIGEEESPTEVKQPQLASYKIDPWFVVENGGIRFRAAVNGVTTSGSGYPRSELREMVDNGSAKASWSSTAGVHTLFIDQAITHVPEIKQDIVAGQIHDADDDIIVIRLEYPKLFVNVDGDNVATLDENYTLGKRFAIRFVVQNGKTEVFYNNNIAPSYTLNKKYSDAYFKAGVYTQSNCDREKSSLLCNDNNFGEVIIYKVSAAHE